MKIFFEHTLPGGQIVRIVQGDITAETSQAIVNAANEWLKHGGGVAGAISRRGGEVIQRESDAWVQRHGPVATGSAAITSAGQLPANYVIHAVGPVWGSGDEEQKLASAVKSALALANQHGVVSISMPGISSGIFGGPKNICAQVIMEATVAYLQQEPPSSLQELRFCNIDEPTVTAFVTAAQQLFGTA
jgi:putative ATPase